MLAMLTHRQHHQALQKERKIKKGLSND